MHFLVTNEARRRLLRLGNNNEVSNDLDMRHMTRRYRSIINRISNNSIPTIIVMIMLMATIKVNNNNNTNSLSSSHNSITTILHLSTSPTINILLNRHRRIILLLIISTRDSVVVVLRLQTSRTTNTNNNRHRNNTNHYHHHHINNNNTLVVINSTRLVTMRRRAMMMATIRDAALLRANHLRPFMKIDARLRQLATTNIRRSSSSSNSSSSNNPAATTMIAVMRHPMTAMRRATNNISSSSTRRHNNINNNNTISKTVTHHRHQPTTMLRLHLTVILTNRGFHRVTTISTTLDLASTHSRRLSNSHTIKVDHSSCHRNNCRLSSSCIVTINRWRHRVRHVTTSHITKVRQQMFVANLFRVTSAVLVRLRRLVPWQRRAALLSLCAMTTVRQRSPSGSESATKMQRRSSRRMLPTRATTVRAPPRKVVRTTMTASVRKARTMSTVKRVSLWRTTSARRHDATRARRPEPIRRSRRTCRKTARPQTVRRSHQSPTFMSAHTQFSRKHEMMNHKKTMTQ
jgi:hypothetical protein